MGTSAAAKYRHPKTGATWTGHGRAPAWIVSAKDRSKFLIDGEAGRASVATEKSATAGNYVRGPQAPKYHDPETGATWSGRGPAPAWLAAAKDRTAFLIAGAGENAAKQSATAAKKVAANKVATNKATANKAASQESAAKNGSAALKKSPATEAPVKKTVAKKAVAKKVAAAG